MDAPLVAACAAAVAVLAGWDDGDARLGRRLTQGKPAREGSRRRRRASWGRWGGPAAVLAVATAGTVAGAGTAAAVLVASIALLTAAELLERAQARRAARETAAEVVRAGEGLAGLLRTGAIPATALAALSGDHPVLQEAAAAQAVGGDAAAALRRGATGAGRAGLAQLAAAWEVSARTGASLGAAVEAIAAELARRQEVESTVTVELAASRTAGRLMALLPLAGVGLGFVLGGDPVGFLLAGPAGWLCLVSATALAAAGLLWTDRLAERARR
nr:pilus assembly protein TadB [Propionibacterium sp.]